MYLHLFNMLKKYFLCCRRRWTATPWCHLSSINWQTTPISPRGPRSMRRLMMMRGPRRKLLRYRGSLVLHNVCIRALWWIWSLTDEALTFVLFSNLQTWVPYFLLHSILCICLPFMLWNRETLSVCHKWKTIVNTALLNLYDMYYFLFFHSVICRCFTLFTGRVW